MAISPQEIKVILSAVDQLSPTLKAIERQVGQTSNSMKQGFAVGAGFAVVGTALRGIEAAFGATRGAVIDFNAQLDQARAAFTGLLGSGEKAESFLQDLQKFAATTPFEFPDVLKGSQRFLGMGVSVEKVIPLMRDIGTLTAAMGGNSESINRVSLAISQMLAKGKVSAQDMNQLAEAGVQGWQILADKLGMTVGQVRELSETAGISASTLVSALQDAANSPGMTAVAEKMSQTWQAGLSNMQDGIRMLIAGGFRPMFDEATKVVLGIGNWLTKSQEAKDMQVQLQVAVRGVMATLGPLAAAALDVGRTLLSWASALPVINQLAAALAGVKAPTQTGGIISSDAVGDLRAVQGELKGIRDQIATNQHELDEMPKRAQELTAALKATEQPIKNNAQQLREAQGALRESKAAAEAVTAEYEKQAKNSAAALRQNAAAQAAVRNQAEAVKAAYEGQLAPLKAAADAIKNQQDVLRTTADDIKARFAGMAAPIQAALSETETALRANRDAATDIRAAYEGAITPLERQLDALKRQVDTQRDLEDIAMRRQNAEIRAAMLAAQGDPVKRAQLAERLEALKATEDEVRLAKQRNDLEKRRKEGKDISDEERRLLDLEAERLGIQAEMNGMVDKEALARARQQKAELDARKEQMDIQREQEDLVRKQQMQPLIDQIAALKQQEEDRLRVLDMQRTALERQASDQKAQLDALKAAEAQELAAVDARMKALEAQSRANEAAQRAVEARQAAELAALEARGKELDRQRDALEAQAQAAKDALEAQLEPIQKKIDDQQKVIDGLQKERDELAGQKTEIEGQLAALEKRRGEIEAANKALEAQAKALADQAAEIAKMAMPPSMAQDMKDLATATKEVSVALQEIGSVLTPLLVGLASFKLMMAGAAITAAVMAGALSPVVLIIAGIATILGLTALAWSKDFGSMRTDTERFVAYLTGTVGPDIQAFFAAVDAYRQGDAALWNAYWAEKIAAFDRDNAALAARWNAWQDERKAATDAWFAGLKAGWNAWQDERKAAWEGFWSGLTDGAKAGWDSMVKWLSGALEALRKQWDDFLKNLPKFQLPWQQGGGMQTTSYTGGAGGVPARGAPYGDARGVAGADATIAYAARRASEMFGTEAAKAFVAVLLSESPSSAPGDYVNGVPTSFGPLQFNTRGQLADFARYMNMTLEQAAQYATDHPDVAIDYALSGYIGDALKRGIELGLSGPDLAVFVSKVAQRPLAGNELRPGQLYPQAAGVVNQSGGGMRSWLMLPEGASEDIQAYADAVAFASEQDKAWYEQQQALAAMLNRIPVAINTGTAGLMEMGSVIDPLIQSVSTGQMSLEDLQKTLVTLAATTGVATDPLRGLSEGTYTAGGALERLAETLGQTDPRFKALVDNFNAAGGNSATLALDFLNLLKTFQQAPAAIAPATAAVDAAGNAIAEAAPEVNPFQPIVTQAQTALAQLPGVVTPPVQEAMDAIVALINDSVGPAHDAAMEVGLAIADGMAAGIEEGAGKIEDAAREAAKSAYEAAMDELESGSPSRVFMRVGRSISEGLALGISGGTGGVSSAMSRLLRAPSDVAMPNAVGGGLDYDRLAQAIVQAQAQQDIRVDLDGQKVGRLVRNQTVRLAQRNGGTSGIT